MEKILLSFASTFGNATTEDAISAFSVILIGLPLLIILYYILKWTIKVDEKMSVLREVVQTYKQLQEEKEIKKNKINMNYKDFNLKQGEVVLFNTSSNTYYKFRDLIEACKRAVNAGRSPENGWNIVDDLGITYEKEDWAFFAQLPLPKD